MSQSWEKARRENTILEDNCGAGRAGNGGAGSAEGEGWNDNNHGARVAESARWTPEGDFRESMTATIGQE